MSLKTIVLTGVKLAATAGLMVAVTGCNMAQTDKPMPAKMTKCGGVNSCKGMSDCATAKNSCKGLNACKGKGWMSVSERSCLEQGGSILLDR